MLRAMSPTLVGALAAFFFALTVMAAAQAPTSVQLTNSVGQPVDVYVESAAGGGPTFQTTIQPGGSEMVTSSVGETWIFGVNQQEVMRHRVATPGFEQVNIADPSRPTLGAAPRAPEPPRVQQGPSTGQAARPFGQQPLAAQPFGQRPLGQAPAGQRPLSQQPFGQGQNPQRPLGGAPQAGPPLQGFPSTRPPLQPQIPQQPPQRPAVAETGPSFSCSGNLNAAERTLCQRPDIAEYDRMMADVYKWLRTELNATEQRELRSDQQDWLRTRNACRTDGDCLLALYLDRVAYLNEYMMPDDDPPVEVTYPFPAKSWGGKVRAGPGVNFRQLGSLREGERISLLEKREDKLFQDRPWFRIRYRGRVGYHWGGIICPIGQHIDGTYQICE